MCQYALPQQDRESVKEHMLLRMLYQVVETMNDHDQLTVCPAPSWLMEALDILIGRPIGKIALSI